jgi:hypothetical protein
MAHFEDNTNFYPTVSLAGEFDPFDFYTDPFLSTTVAGKIPTFDTLADCWDMTGQPDPMAGPSTSLWAQTDYGKHHDYCLIYSCLTCGLQIRWFQPPCTQPKLTVTPRAHTPVHTTRNFKLKPNPRNYWTGTVSLLVWGPLPLEPRPPVVVRISSASHR